MSKNKEPRLTERLNRALAKASAALAVARSDAKHAPSCCVEAARAVEEAQEIMNAISRAASSI